MIDDLPDLEDLEGPPPHQRAINRGQIRGSRYPGAEMLPDGQEDKFGKFIRQSHRVLPEAGMSARGPPPQMAGYPMGEPPPDHAVPMLEEEYQKPEEGAKTYAMPPNSPSCLDVAEHIANCPICSKFYNDDKSIYIIAIIVLAVICILLLKKVLDK
jgi:hypothetical protein